MRSFSLVKPIHIAHVKTQSYPVRFRDSVRISARFRVRVTIRVIIDQHV